MNAATYNATVGRVMRIARKAANLTTREMAVRVQEPQSAVSRLENGVTPWTLERIERFCAAFGCEVGDVLRIARDASASQNTDAA